METAKRRALRILRMVHEFHKQGYQRMRIEPGLSASGCSWRCAITPKSNILRSHGARLANQDDVVARYTSGQQNEYFGWEDAKTDTVQELARKFSSRFPVIVRCSLGDDWNYAGWYVKMLGYAEQGRFPVAYADWYEKPDPRFLPLDSGDSDLPMPPPGDADDPTWMR